MTNRFTIKIILLSILPVILIVLTYLIILIKSNENLKEKISQTTEEGLHQIYIENIEGSTGSVCVPLGKFGQNC